MFRSAPLTFVLYIFLIPLLGVGVFLLLAWYLRVRTTRVVIEGDDLVHETGVLTRDRAQLDVHTIRSVKVRQGFTQRLFGIGDVSVFTSGDEAEIVISGIPNPAFIRERLLGKVEL